MALSERADSLSVTLKDAMRAAAERPGRYGGRYVAELARKASKSSFTPHKPAKYVVLDDDDPELYKNRLELEVLAQCTPEKCYGIGRARHYINEDGTVTVPQ